MNEWCPEAKENYLNNTINDYNISNYALNLNVINDNLKSNDKVGWVKSININEGPKIVFDWDCFYANDNSLGDGGYNGEETNTMALIHSISSDYMPKTFSTGRFDWDNQEKKYDLTGAKLTLEIAKEKVEISDDIEAGSITGTVCGPIYKGDHWAVIVRTEDDDAFIIDTPYQYNDGDKVSLILKKEDIKARIKGDLDEYEI